MHRENLRTENLSMAAAVLREKDRTEQLQEWSPGVVWKAEAMLSVTGAHWQLVEGTGSCRTQAGAWADTENSASLPSRDKQRMPHYAECRCVCFVKERR